MSVAPLLMVVVPGKVLAPVSSCVPPAIVRSVPLLPLMTPEKIPDALDNVRAWLFLLMSTEPEPDKLVIVRLPGTSKVPLATTPDECPMPPEPPRLSVAPELIVVAPV